MRTGAGGNVDCWADWGGGVLGGGESNGGKEDG